MAPPPPNGRKLWRVQRQPSTTGNQQVEHNSSQECLQNSLKIVAAGKAYSTKRPPLRRPKNQPGKPKDFVFVDLSPIRSEEEESNKLNTQQKIASTYPANVSPVSEASNDSFSASSDEESMFSLYDSTNINSNAQFSQSGNEYNSASNYMQSNAQLFSMPEVGLGLNMLDDWQFDVTYQQNFNQYIPSSTFSQQEQQSLKMPKVHQRSESTPYMQYMPTFEATQQATPNRKRAASADFSYKTPSPKRTTFSQRSTPSGLEAFMMFNDQLSVALPKEMIPTYVQDNAASVKCSTTSTYTSMPRSVANAADAFDMAIQSVPFSPVTDDSEIEELHNTKLGKPIDLSTTFDAHNMLIQKQNDFDLNAFVAF
ncbi:hypothetical protein CAAN3_04S04192 [[Candida] anglica]